MSTRSQLLIQNFRKEEGGSVAVAFGVASMALLLLAGLAVDLSRVSNVQQKLFNAGDSTSLAIGRAMLEGKLSDAELLELGQKYYTENVRLATQQSTVAPPKITFNRTTGEVNVIGSSTVKMTLGALSSTKEMVVNAPVQAVFKTKDIEVGMALDITGSMKDPDATGVRKIDGLRAAFAAFANKLIPDQPVVGQKIRVALAPYSASVNLGPFAARASANRSKDGCVTESKSRSASEANVVYYAAADGIIDIDDTEKFAGNPASAPAKDRVGYSCPLSQITPLSENKNDLIAKVNDYKPDGWTAGHLGVQWAWNLVSDQWNWNGVTGDSYDKIKDDKLVKAVVIMTDGIFNTSYHGARSSEQAIALCTAMKAKGVEVFTIAFSAPGAPADVKTLKACASPGDNHFANASSKVELETAFNSFASELTRLRLAQ